MFAKLSTLALALPLVSALTIYPPTDWAVPGTVTLQWSGTTSDPSSFSIELVADTFHNTYAIGNNVPLANGQITFPLPELSPGAYSIEFVNPGNINQVYASAGPFTIAAATTTPTPTSTGTSTDSSITMSASSTPSVTASVVTTPLASALSAPATTGTSSAPSTTPSNFNASGAGSFKLAGVAPAAALVLSAVAGAAMVF